MGRLATWVARASLGVFFGSIAACASATYTFPSCGEGQAMCDLDCVDLTSDAFNCGSCGRRCSAGDTCWKSTCLPECVEGWVRCGDGNACVDPETDANHCGECGARCPEGEVCVAGGCQIDCKLTETLCGTDCADLTSDPLHCGGCGQACPGAPHASPSCDASECGYECTEGFGDCDANTANGCETNTSTAVAHCGACNSACPLVTNGVPSCEEGTCGAVCNEGRADCDGNLQNGCETNLNDDPQHCGMCGAACPQNHGCHQGMCTPQIIYSSSFIYNTPASPQQCDAWNDFRGNLVGKTFKSVTIRGSGDPNGVTCNEPVAATSLCQALGGGFATSTPCNGRTWNVASCGQANGQTGWEINANGNSCSCATGYVARPCIGNNNWGGVNGATCGAQNQTIEVVCSQ